MANTNKAHPANVPGPLFTDTTCIDCGTCFHLAENLFKESDDSLSVVIKQPDNLREWEEAKRAVLSCPTHSIGVNSAPAIFKRLGEVLPLEIQSDLFYLGYSSPDSFGANSYLIRSESGNIMVDSPSFHPHLIRQLEALGGVKWIFLTHRDDVADHRRYGEYFGARRIIHQLEVSPDTQDCEVIISGKVDTSIIPDTKIIMTPGHTQGHMNLLYKENYLFTGDHLFFGQNESLYASKEVCWFSWERQIESLRKLRYENFSWILPGHGGWAHFGVDKAGEKLQQLLDKLEG